MVWHPESLRHLFTRNNDDGEHRFDNWYLRGPLEEAAQRRGLIEEESLIIHSERFQNGKDGPCHPPAFRKRFWADVLRSLDRRYVPRQAA